MALLTTVALDARPTVFGNKAVVTGTLLNSSGTSGHLDLSGALSGIDVFLISGVGATALAAPAQSIDGTLVYLATITAGSGGDYQFMAIGNRA